MFKSRQVLIIIFVAILLTTFTEFHSFASVVEHDENDFVIPSPDEYIPEKITSILKENNLNIVDNNSTLLIQDLITKSFDDNVINMPRRLSELTYMIILIAFIRQLRLYSIGKAFTILPKLSIIYHVITTSHNLLSITKPIINNITELFSLTIPAIASVSLMSGNSISAITSTSSLTLILTIFEWISTQFLFPFSVVLLSLFITENLYPSLGAIGITKLLKKNLISVLCFSFSFILALSALNGTLAVSKDTAYIRGIKFATSNIIPLIGSSVGEAMKTITAGVSGIKSTLGLSAAYAILALVLPALINLFAHKITFRLAGIFASLIGSAETHTVIDGAVDIFDIFIALLTSITIVGLFSVFIFTNTVQF